MRWRNKKSGAAFVGATNLTRLHGGDKGFHFLECIGVELVVNPAAILPIPHDARVFQHAKVERQPRLRGVECIGELANTTLSSAKQLDDLEPGFVGECVKELDCALGP